MEFNKQYINCQKTLHDLFMETVNNKKISKQIREKQLEALAILK